MSKTRESILELLKAEGLGHKSVEDVISEFASSDELSAHLVEGEDVEQIVLAHMPEYLAQYGAAAAVGAADPTATQAGAAAMPAATAVQAQASDRLLDRNYSNMRELSAQTEMAAVLIDKPWPGEWAANIGKLHVKGEPADVSKKLEEGYKPDKDIDALLSAPSTSFIPSNEQMRALQYKWLAAHTPEPGKKAPADPIWFGFDNEAARASILNILNAGDASFAALIAPKTATGEGAQKVNAWKWNTKGFVLKMPDTTPGSTTLTEKYVNKQQLQAILAIQLGGLLLPKTEGGLGARFTQVKKKTSNQVAGAQPSAATLRIINNGTGSNPELIPINEKGAAFKKTAMQSIDFYFVCTVNKNGKWSLRKQRLSLVWESGPVWTVLDKFAKVFPPKAASLEKQTRTSFEASKLVAQQLLATDALSAMTLGLGDFLNQVDDEVTRIHANAQSVGI